MQKVLAQRLRKLERDRLKFARCSRPCRSRSNMR
ncbi:MULTISPECIES: hypothetical protein [Paraburkholderia]|nr:MULTISPECIES: hypothetical protein [Paraburkholderia]